MCSVSFIFCSMLQRLVGRLLPAPRTAGQERLLQSPLKIQGLKGPVRQGGRNWDSRRDLRHTGREKGNIHVAVVDRVGFRLDTGKYFLMRKRWGHRSWGWWGNSERLTASSLPSGLERTGRPCTSVTPSSSSWSCCCHHWA